MNGTRFLTDFVSRCREAMVVLGGKLSHLDDWHVKHLVGKGIRSVFSVEDHADYLLLTLIPSHVVTISEVA